MRAPDRSSHTASQRMRSRADARAAAARIAGRRCTRTGRRMRVSSPQREGANREHLLGQAMRAFRPTRVLGRILGDVQRFVSCKSLGWRGQFHHVVTVVGGAHRVGPNATIRSQVRKRHRASQVVRLCDDGARDLAFVEDVGTAFPEQHQGTRELWIAKDLSLRRGCSANVPGRDGIGIEPRAAGAQRQGVW